MISQTYHILNEFEYITPVYSYVILIAHYNSSLINRKLNESLQFPNRIKTYSYISYVYQSIRCYRNGPGVARDHNHE